MTIFVQDRKQVFSKCDFWEIDLSYSFRFEYDSLQKMHFFFFGGEMFENQSEIIWMW